MISSLTQHHMRLMQMVTKQTRAEKNLDAMTRNSTQADLNALRQREAVEEQQALHAAARAKALKQMRAAEDAKVKAAVSKAHFEANKIKHTMGLLHNETDAAVKKIHDKSQLRIEAMENRTNEKIEVVKQKSEAEIVEQRRLRGMHQAQAKLADKEARAAK